MAVTNSFELRATLTFYPLASKTAQRKLWMYAFITVTSHVHALNMAVKSSKKHSSSAEFSSTNHVSFI